jgi:predicted Zn-ribbon and HTH transcriptional regulator
MRTRRQEIVAWLTEKEWEFDDLRHDLVLTVKVLEEDLRHIERSVRAAGQRLVITPARCEACDFVFNSTALHQPGRCPSCRDRRIAGPWLRIV